MPQKRPIVIAIDGTSASGKSTNAKLVAKALNCLQKGIDPHNAKAVVAACRRWKAALKCMDGHVYLTVDGYYPEREIRSADVSAAVSHVAAIPKVREWMKKTQRECIQFGNLVMEGRDIGTNVFPETDFKYYLDAHLEERTRRRAADGLQENLAARDQRDSQRAAAPLMIALGAKVINNSHLTSEQTSGLIIADVKKQLAERESIPMANR